MPELPPTNILNFEGPEGETLFRRFLTWCLPPEWQSMVQREVDAAFAHLEESVDDRAVAVVGALLVESAVDELVAAHVPGYNAIATNRDFSFSLRIELARALRLCPGRLLDGADTIRGIRNDFAHRLSLSTFDECNPARLTAARDQLRSVNTGLANGKTAREVFVNLVGMLFLGLRGYRWHVERLNEYVRWAEEFRRGLHEYWTQASRQAGTTEADNGPASRF